MPIKILSKPLEKLDAVGDDVELLRGRVGTVETDVHDYGENQERGHITDASGEESLASILRWLGGSGIVGTRQYNENVAFDSAGRRHDTIYSAVNLHDHSNYKIMPGIGEIAMIINGNYYQSRHNDYIMRSSIAGAPSEFATENIKVPSLPSAVAALPTGVSGATVDLVGDTQAKWLSRLHLDNPDQIEMHLAYAELFWEISTDDSISDRGASFRHFNADASLSSYYETSRAYNADGSKLLSENAPLGAIIKKVINSDGSVTTAYLNFRILTAKVGTMAETDVFSVAPAVTITDSDSHGHNLVNDFTLQQALDLRDAVVASVTLQSIDSFHTHEYVITWDGTWFVGVDTNTSHQHEVLIERGFTGGVPYDEAKAAAGTIDSANSFSMVDDLIRSGSYSALTNEEYAATRSARFNVAGLERMCERVPGIDGHGASIRDVDSNGDHLLDRDTGTLNAAYYHHTFAIGQNDAAGRNTAGRGFNDPNLFIAKTENPKVLDGVSMMIPLEIIAIDPIIEWNPYGFAIASSVGSVTGTGTEVNPYDSIHESTYWYTTPSAFYTDSSSPDPADTSGNKWVKDSSGTAREVYASGIRPFTPNLARRIRFPVYPVYQEYSYEGVRIQKLNAKIAALDARITALEP